MLKSLFSRQSLIYVFLTVVVAIATFAVVAVLFNITDRKDEASQYPLKVVEISETELDPAVWGANFPYQYDSFKRTQEDYGTTPFGGSTVYSKLERYPAMVRLWAGYAFSKDHNEERGHYYAQIDQANTQRVKLVSQPGACINCHSAEVPQLVEEMGWEAFNKTPFNDYEGKLHLGSSCADCHNPDTMELRLTRPGLINALAANGVDWTQASRQEMRSLVCSQCHVEYYFQGDNKLLTFPWTGGMTVDAISDYYNEAGFKDFTHAETGAPMIKIQHPETELASTGLHARSGVSCADCHMPYVREGSVKVSDHWLRSPLTNLEQACQTCHNIPAEELKERVTIIQNTTASLLRRSEEALIAAIDAIVAAKEAGASDEALVEVQQLHREASLRWDFISSENSTGFHSPQESARVLAESIDMARQAELKATELLNSLTPAQASAIK